MPSFLRPIHDQSAPLLHITHIIPSHLPQSGWHGEEAEDEIRDCEGGDKDVPRGAHALVPQHRANDQDIATQARHQQHYVHHHQGPKGKESRLNLYHILLQCPSNYLIWTLQGGPSGQIVWLGLTMVLAVPILFILFLGCCEIGRNGRAGGQDYL